MSPGKIDVTLETVNRGEMGGRCNKDSWIRLWNMQIQIVRERKVLGCVGLGVGGPFKKDLVRKNRKNIMGGLLLTRTSCR